jgi:hypothetical protein
MFTQPNLSLNKLRQLAAGQTSTLSVNNVQECLFSMKPVIDLHDDRTRKFYSSLVSKSFSVSITK